MKVLEHLIQPHAKISWLKWLHDYCSSATGLSSGYRGCIGCPYGILNTSGCICEVYKRLTPLLKDKTHIPKYWKIPGNIPSTRPANLDFLDTVSWDHGGHPIVGGNNETS